MVDLVIKFHSAVHLLTLNSKNSCHRKVVEIYYNYKKISILKVKIDENLWFQWKFIYWGASSILLSLGLAWCCQWMSPHEGWRADIIIVFIRKDCKSYIFVFSLVVFNQTKLDFLFILSCIKKRSIIRTLIRREEGCVELNHEI